MDELFKTSLGKMFKQQRKSCGLTQEQLGLMVGVNRLTIRRIEYGTANPTLDVLLKLCDGMGVAFSDLVKRAAEDSRKSKDSKQSAQYAAVKVKKPKARKPQA